MTVLFCIDGEAALEGLAGVVRVLRRRGHDTHVWVDAYTNGPAVAEVRATGAAVEPSPRSRGDHWFAVMRRLWAARDYVRTLDRRWAAMPVERHGAKSAAPPAFAALVEGTPLRFGPARRVLDAVLDVLERSQQVPRTLVEAFGRINPDVVVVYPVLRWGYVQGDYLRAARRLGIRLAVITDGDRDLEAGPRLRPTPDALLVWNEMEVDAAVKWHGCVPACVTASGSISLARWTETASDEERRRVRPGLKLGHDEPFVVYAGSDLGKASVHEAGLAARFEDALKADSSTAHLNVVVTPHPKIASPDNGGLVNRRALVAEAIAVVGVHTRLLAEASVAGTAAVVLSDPQFAREQHGSPRLGTLLRGLPRAESPTEAAAIVSRIMAGDTPSAVPDAAWRPAGDPAEATADAIERLAASVAPRRQGAGFAVLARPVVWAPVAVRQAAESRRRLKKETNRAIRKSRERYARYLRQTVKAVTEGRLAVRAFVFGGAEDREVEELEAARATFETITEMARSGKPIVVGPWLSEVGFELLYWIPFVRWAKTYGNIREDRLIVLSRGGAAPWYGDITSRYVDLLSLYSVDEFRQRNDERIERQGGQKQTGRTRFEREIFDRAQSVTGINNAEWLHPSVMYNLFNLFWMQRAPASLVQRFTVHRPVAAPNVELPPGLPARFVAAKFYTNASFPDTPVNRRFLADVLRQLTARHDVVLLNTGIAVDDHGEFTPAESARLHRVDHLLEPQDNLRLQTRIIAAADAYVGTYGGFSYLAPLCGVHAITFFSEGSAFRHDHLEVAKRVFEELDSGRFIAARTTELDFLQEVVGPSTTADMRITAN